MAKNRDLPENSGPTRRQMPEGTHDENETTPNVVPAYPPPAMFLVGNVAEQSVYVPLWSYTVAMAAIDRYAKAAQKQRGASELKLYDTGGSWLQADWRELKTVSLSSRPKK